MLAVRTPLLALLLLAACDGNPFVETPVDPGDGTGDSVATLPGTTDPKASSNITRREAQVTAQGSTGFGNGYAQGYIYNKAADTFTVDNLAFDGANVYRRGAAVATLGPAKVYEADITTNDPVTGVPIDQFSYRALYGVSTTGKTNFAIVRTGSYVPYGFGGFVYNRSGGVTLPSSGQAHFAGNYAGIRDFNGAGGMEYTTADMTMDIDFSDFNDVTSGGISGNGVAGQVTNRKIFDINGNDITASVVAAINTELTPDVALTGLPVLVFKVGPGVMDHNGEMQGQLQSTVDSSGSATTFESGKYYAVISGSGAKEVGGIIVVESSVPGASGVTARETGGFILYRP
jgi:hypothetical protein